MLILDSSLIDVALNVGLARKSVILDTDAVNDYGHHHHHHRHRHRHHHHHRHYKLVNRHFAGLKKMIYFDESFSMHHKLLSGSKWETSASSGFEP